MTSVQMGRGGVKKCTQFADKYRLGFEVKEGGVDKNPKILWTRTSYMAEIFDHFTATSPSLLLPAILVYYCFARGK